MNGIEKEDSKNRINHRRAWCPESQGKGKEWLTSHIRIQIKLCPLALAIHGSD